MADPYAAQVVLLLPMNGAAGGTVFQDLSPVGRAITRYGQTQTVTNESRFYGASAYFDGSGDYLQMADSPDFHFGSGDFTLEAWIRPQIGTGVIQGIVAQRNSSSYNHSFSFWVHATDTNLAFECNNNSFLHYAGGAARYGVWQHVAVARAGNVIRTFSDGILVREQELTLTLTDYNQVIQIGRASSSLSNGYFKGHMNDLRVTKGVARYTANFTPPSELVPYYQPLAVKVYGEVAWRECPMKRWSGEQWESALLRRHDGYGWPFAV